MYSVNGKVRNKLKELKINNFELYCTVADNIYSGTRNLLVTDLFIVSDCECELEIQEYV